MSFSEWRGPFGRTTGGPFALTRADSLDFVVPYIGIQITWAPSASPPAPCFWSGEPT